MRCAGKLWAAGCLAAGLLIAGMPAAHAGDAWPGRGNDLRNTGNAGYDPAIQAWTVRHLDLLHTLPTPGAVGATPVFSDGLLVVGDLSGTISVFDLETASPLLRVDTGGREIRTTAVVGRVTTPAGEERRVWVAAGADPALWCLSLEKILDDRDSLNANPARSGDGYFCDGPGDSPWPLALRPSGSEATGLDASPKLSSDQPICVSGCTSESPEIRIRDVLYVPTAGRDCDDGQLWALDAWTGEVYWTFDPVESGDGLGGVVRTTPPMNRDRTRIYAATAGCSSNPLTGELERSLVSLDAATGKVEWFHQRRLHDAAGLEIGSGLLVADVEDEFGNPGCHVVVSNDQNGCLYAFEQDPDVPSFEEHGFDPLREGQQRVLWRQCFVPGGPGGGFDGMNAALSGRLVMLQSAGAPVAHVGADDANAFAVEACRGKAHWASSDISNGRTDGAVASRYFFQLGVTRTPSGEGAGPDAEIAASRPASEIQVVFEDAGLASAPALVATVDLSDAGRPGPGSGGIAIVDGRLYVPMSSGVAVVGVVPGSNASAPRGRGRNLFLGPYPAPVAPEGPAPERPDPDVTERSIPMVLDKAIEALVNYFGVE